MNLISSFEPISGIPVRDFLKKIQFTSTADHLQTALSLVNGPQEPTFITITEVDEKNKNLLKKNIDNHLINLAAISADWFKKQGHQPQVQVHVADNDYISNVFFTALKNAGIKINPPVFSYESYSDLLNAVETASVEMVASGNIDLQALINYASDRMFVGDYQTAYSMISKIQEAQRNETCHYILSFCTYFLNN
ncbi:hypothetical protein CIK05_02270 [Bdellovibrio sp. qaytius]|nr:hypothetical protein CIK05_02270 [Bdellovibrio sp. qaytius]